MVAMSGSGPGYAHAIFITPYMHLLIYHIPILLRKHGSLGSFSGQGNSYVYSMAGSVSAGKNVPS